MRIPGKTLEDDHRDGKSHKAAAPNHYSPSTPFRTASTARTPFTPAEHDTAGSCVTRRTLENAIDVEGYFEGFGRGGGCEGVCTGIGDALRIFGGSAS